MIATLKTVAIPSPLNWEITTVTIHMDKTLREIVEQAYEGSRPGRSRRFVDRKLFFSELLSDLEADGDAMRYLNSKGQIAWKATPSLRDHLNDLRLDAEADLADEEV
jgi:hypothetical protein